VPKTHELIVGFDHELVKDFGVGASVTYRRMTSFNWTPYIGVRSTNYVKGGTFTATGLPDGSTYTAPYYTLNETGVPADTLAAGAREYVTQDGYHQQFLGFEAIATKRLSNRWMARFGFSTNNHTEYFDNPATAIGDPTPNESNPFVNGGIVVVSSTGSGKSGIYQLLPKYQFIANGLYQLPYNIDIGANWMLRQGFGQPWYYGYYPDSGDALASDKDLLLNPDLNKNRLPYVSTTDIRIAYRLKIKRASVNFDFDIFNLLNSATVLGNQYDYSLTGTTGFNQTLEIMNPRIMRFGVRFNF
jgi:hypothetical protein